MALQLLAHQVSSRFVCRYAAGDKVESWLLELLCLNAAEHVPKLPARLPHPTECDLYYINRDTLFSYHKVGSMRLHPW